MKKNLKVALDISLIVTLLCQMPYVFLGDKAHEWLGLLFIVLVFVHVKINLRSFTLSLRKSWTRLKLINFALILFATVSFLAITFSAPYISRYVFGFLSLSGGTAKARLAHLLFTYWGFIFFSLHLGFHLQKTFGLTRLSSRSPRSAKTVTISALIVTLMAAPFGLKAFLTNHIVSYLFLRQQFAFFDLSVPLWRVMAEYLAMMVTLAALAYWLRRLLISKKA